MTKSYRDAVRLEPELGSDDSLDLFGVPGITGALLSGVFATGSAGSMPGLLEGKPVQVQVPWPRR